MRRKKKKNHRPDSRRAAVYRWQASLGSYYPLLKKKLSRRQCLSLVGSVSAEYRIWPPTVKFLSGGSWCFYHPNFHTVELQPWGMNRVIVLHEMTHAIYQAYHPDHSDPHGPFFARVFLNLLVDRCRVDEDVAIQKGINPGHRKRKVRFAKQSSVPGPERLRSAACRR